MDFKYVYKEYNKVLSNMLQYALDKDQVDSFLKAEIVIKQLIEDSYKHEHILSKSLKWLKGRHTNDLKELVKSDLLDDYNTFCYIDSSSQYKTTGA